MAESHLSIRSSVRRSGAQRYLLISLVSFAGSVMATRAFLALTGYPKIGSGSIHIAHVLWGGLLLFIAALLPLVYANRWVFNYSAALSGIGVGLFIDEVGKFITMNNDYFFPPAAPIIYALFLLTVLVYMRVQKPRAWNARAELYHILDSLTEILDHDLQPNELAVMKARLNQISQNAAEPDLIHLSQALSNYLGEEKIRLAPTRLSTTDRALRKLRSFETRLFNRERVRLTLLLALTIAGALAIGDVFSRLFTHGQLMPLDAILTANMLRGNVRSAVGANFFFVYLALQILVGILVWVATALVVSGKEKRGLDLASIGMVLALTMVNLLAFFVDQFSAALTALIELAVFLSIVYYRRRYFRSPPPD